MATQVMVTHAARHFADYINRVVYRGERFILVRGKMPVAELVPVPSARRVGDLPGILATLPHLGPTEAERFGEDIESARSDLARRGITDPWAS